MQDIRRSGNLVSERPPCGFGPCRFIDDIVGAAKTGVAYPYGRAILVEQRVATSRCNPRVQLAREPVSAASHHRVRRISQCIRRRGPTILSTFRKETDVTWIPVRPRNSPTGQLTQKTPHFPTINLRFARNLDGVSPAPRGRGSLRGRMPTRIVPSERRFFDSQR